MTDLSATRETLLDALEALEDHLDAVVLVGSQAVYLHTGDAHVALAPATKDSDLAIDTRDLATDPRIDEVMAGAGFTIDPIAEQPGSWMNREGIPVDLMVPEFLAGPGGRSARAARIPPHARHTARRGYGLEAAVVDNAHMEVRSLDASSQRSAFVRVAGPAALLVAKLHKLGERSESAPGRLVDKDAHDIYRLLRGTSTESVAETMRHLTEDSLAGAVTSEALEHLGTLFAGGPDAICSSMAGEAERLLGNADEVSAAVALLARELLEAVDGRAVRE